MKNQAIFSLKDRSEKLICRLLQFLFCALRVKGQNTDNKICLLNLRKRFVQAVS